MLGLSTDDVRLGEQVAYERVVQDLENSGATAVGRLTNGTSERGEKKTWHSEEEQEAEEGGEVDGATVGVTRLPQVFAQSKSHKLCTKMSGENGD